MKHLKIKLSELPEIDLLELAKTKARNKKQRLAFLDYYAQRIKQGTA